MRRFTCLCGQELFFENSLCFACGRTVGFDPATLEMVAREDHPQRSLRACENAGRFGVCNWWVNGSSTQDLCRSCRLNAVIPNLDQPENLERWHKLEQAKRRLLYTLLSLELPLETAGQRLHFAFLEDQRTNDSVAEEMVFTGYGQGKITILAAEADDLFRESQRTSMLQRYRTVLGHMRHESGHFFWEALVRDRDRLDDFRKLFGDERTDYQQALESFYREPRGESPDFVSPYAQAHPLEDWAESWSHALHIVDTVETAIERELVRSAAQRSAALTSPRMPVIDDTVLESFAALAVSLNELNRGLGLTDAYPFVLAETVRAKLRFIGSVVSTAAVAT